MYIKTGLFKGNANSNAHTMDVEMEISAAFSMTQVKKRTNKDKEVKLKHLINVHADSSTVNLDVQKEVLAHFLISRTPPANSNNNVEKGTVNYIIVKLMGM